MQKDIYLIGPKIYVISDLHGKQIIGTFYEKDYKLQINKTLELKKYLKQKVINYMLNGKVVIIHLIVGLIKKILYKK